MRRKSGPFTICYETDAAKWLLLPVEIQARELEGKLYLGVEAVEAGWNVIIGRDIRCKNYLPRGIFVENSISPGRASDIRSTIDRGSKVAAWCEEGLVYYHAEEYGRRRVESDSYNQIERYFAWGDRQRDDLVNNLGCDPAKIVTSGNPRFDLLRDDLKGVFDSRVCRIRERFGPIILVNTKFARYNNYMGRDYFPQIMRERGKFRSAEQETEQFGLVEYQGRMMEAFAEGVMALSERFPDRHIIIRPHPSESHDPWNAFARGLGNVSVIFEGNVAEWILAAEVCLHNNCTTGVEAFMMGRPSLSYRPVVDETYETYLPNALCDEVRDLDSLLDTIEGILSDTAIDWQACVGERQAIADAYIASRQGDTASTVILRSLSDVDIPRVRLRHDVRRLGLLEQMLRRRAWPLKRFLRDKKQRAKERYVRQKFAGVALRDVIDFLVSLRAVTGRFDDVKVFELEPNVFCLTK